MDAPRSLARSERIPRFLSKASFGQMAHTPVKNFLAAQGTTLLSNALFPATIKDLLIAMKPESLRDARIGSGVVLQDNYCHPLSEFQVAWSGPGIGYYQRGAAGPFSIEAALILATQLAGINLNGIDRSELRRNIPWCWLGAMTVATGTRNSGTRLYLRPPTGYPFGYNYRPTSLKPAGDADAGFYLAFEVDFDLRARGDKDRNVFVFAVHAIDEHSRVEVKNRMKLRQLTYTTYAPPTATNGPKPGERGQPPAGRTRERTQGSMDMRYDIMA
ncbi:hypothetical protein BD779DRAFT_778576 [Infundibulicybe gibba]|nr:hypothetical protein BD779DRAFT_778576 [Infundibulicybe gibba]